MGLLRDQMEADLALAGYSAGTQRIYLYYARKYAAHFMRSPAEMGAAELRQFLLHRHYGLAAGRNVQRKLATARQLLAPHTPDLLTTSPADQDQPPSWSERFRDLTGIDIMACPCCGGRLIRRQTLPPQPSLPTLTLTAAARASP